MSPVTDSTDPEALTITEATSDDLDELVAAHAVVFAGTMGVALGVRYRRAFVGRFIREPDQIALVAKRSGRIVGYVLGRSIATPDNDRSTTRAAGVGLLLHPWLVLRHQVRREVLAKAFGRGAPASELDPRLRAVEGDLVGIGTMPSERGRGTAKALVAAFTEACVARGWQGISLSVYRDNTSARKLYTSCGYVEIDHPDKPDVVYEYLDTTGVAQG